MKTTIDIADPVLREAKKLAEREGTTLSAVVEDGLRQVILMRASSKTVEVKMTTFKGRGLQPEFQGTGWEKIRDAIYEDDVK